ncbi:GntR family transcriptional regulator [Luteolibacter sp. SL250]|uniref:GntR family transcriptional regulator n=1 Tax=Luteolibacter sp. SL250 TaxID=2995170 RepID=UPI00226E4B2C|nr:GntR family transcriptional regulator [Luteolibacter sp. SL250]WAC18439.1 GntR family transcriptional regulator [Luteolibacter sp. SL250]
MSEPLPEKVYHAIRDRIASGDLQPGERLEFKKMSAELGVSTTPLREAMNKLAMEGLVELHPRLGAVVKRMEPQEAVELFGVREAVEGYAAERAAMLMSGEQVVELGDILAAMKRLIETFKSGKARQLSEAGEKKFLDLDRAFHLHIIDATGNRRLTKLLSETQILERVFRPHRIAHDLAVIEDAWSAHSAIHQAIRNRDPEAARAAMTAHIRRSLEATLSADRKARTSTWLS